MGNLSSFELVMLGVVNQTNNICSKICTIVSHIAKWFQLRDIDKISEEFWKEKTPYTPESRIETFEVIRLQKEGKPKPKNESRYLLTIVFIDPQRIISVR